MRALALSSMICAALVLVLTASSIAVGPLTTDIPKSLPASVMEGSLRSEVDQVDPATLTCDGVITFDDVAGGDSPGTNYDAIFESDGADFGESFVGQILSYNGDFDVLSGSPTGPLAVQAGLSAENLSVYYRYDPTNSQILTGNGPLGWPSTNAIGEGSFAVLFDFDQSEFGFDIVGQDGGGFLYINFFKRDGTLIDTHVIATGSGDVPYGFRRVGGVQDIAGITIHNDDPAGVGFDNLCHDVPGVPGDPVFLDIRPTSCPNPFNVKSNGVLPAAIVGTDGFDVSMIDPATVMLEGVAPLRWSLADVTTPVGPDAEECECNEEGPDGIMDLTLKFGIQAVLAALGVVEDEDVVPLTLTAETFDGASIELVDCVRILEKGKGPETVELLAPPDPTAKEDSSETSWGVIKGLYR
jgi:hypothetical protein